MDPKTNRLLQQAGKLVLLGRLKPALEQYLKIYESEPGDTTLISTIGDLYLRLEDEPSALQWYQKLAEEFEFCELPARAVVVYKKILKLCPHDSQALIRIAALYVQLGDLVNAKRYYRI